MVDLNTNFLSLSGLTGQLADDASDILSSKTSNASDRFKTKVQGSDALNSMDAEQTLTREMKEKQREITRENNKLAQLQNIAEKGGLH